MVANAYGVTTKTLRSWLKRSELPVTQAQHYSPKEFQAMVELFGEPDFEIIEKYKKNRQ